MKPRKMDADKLDVKDNTVVTTYRNAVDRLLRVLDILDAQRFGYKALTSRHFNDYRKWFLMHDVFGFSSQEIAELAHMSLSRVNVIIWRVRDKYKEILKTAKIGGGQVETWPPKIITVAPE